MKEKRGGKESERKKKCRETGSERGDNDMLMKSKNDPE